MENKSNDDSKKSTSFLLQLAPDLKRDLTEISKSEMRSLSNLITYILAGYVKNYKKEHEKEKDD